MAALTAHGVISRIAIIAVCSGLRWFDESDMTLEWSFNGTIVQRYGTMVQWRSVLTVIRGLL